MLKVYEPGMNKCGYSYMICHEAWEKREAAKRHATIV